MLDASGHNQNMLLDFWVSCFLLTFLRLTRRCTLLGATVSVLLSLLVACLCGVHCRWIHPGCGIKPLEFYGWLAAATWVTTFAGMRNRHYLGFAPLLLPLVATGPGLLGLLTGVILNLPLPRKKSPPPPETYGITRVRG